MTVSGNQDSEPTTQRASKKGIWGWMLFDWAAQPFHTLIITFVFAPYFASTVAETPVRGQEIWGYALAAGGVIIALLAPVLGAYADATGPRKPWILGFAIPGAIGCWLLWYATPGLGTPYFLLVAIVASLIGMEFAAIFNNAMMPSLVPRSELGRLSGTAWGLGYVGGLITLILVLGFMAASPETGKTLLGFDPIIGLDPAQHDGARAAGPLTAIWFLVFALPLFLFTPDASRKPNVAGAVAKSLSELWSTIKSLPNQRSYLSFLLSSMFYRDALNGLYSFGGIYAGGVLGWSIIQIGIFGILANITGALGAWLGGHMDDRFGPKSVVTTCILILSICCLMVVSTTPDQALFISLPESASSLPDTVFYVAGALIGAAGGAIQAASRTLLVDQVPPEKVTEAFGLYAMSGKATTFLAPLTVAWMTGVFESQRVGVTPVIALFLIGLVLLPLVSSFKDRKPVTA